MSRSPRTNLSAAVFARYRATLGAVVWLFALTLSAPVWAGDATGTWTLNVVTAAGTGTPTLTLTQQGEAVTGTYKGQLGESPITGTLKGDALELSFAASGMMGSITVSYIGTLTGDEMNGKVKLGDLGEGTFTGKRSM